MLVAAAAVLAAHALLLAAWGARLSGAAAPRALGTSTHVQLVRVAPIAPAAVAPALASPSAATPALPATQESAAPKPPPGRRVAAASQHRAAVAPTAATEEDPADLDPEAAAQAAATAAPAGPSARMASSGTVANAAAGPSAPVYATALPAAGRWAYEFRRGKSSTPVVLRWTNSAEGYEITLSGGDSARAPQWRSRGALDAAGIAPERFSVARRGRERSAANFQRDKGVITFSGASNSFELPPGAQDRLSWMLQLSGVLQANPALGAAGQQVSMWVVGAHGDANLWTFDSQGPQPADPAAGVPEGAVAMLREAARPYDVSVQVWLDPARTHLPVRVLMRLAGTGESTELRLGALQASDPVTGSP